MFSNNGFFKGGKISKTSGKVKREKSILSKIDFSYIKFIALSKLSLTVDEFEMFDFFELSLLIKEYNKDETWRIDLDNARVGIEPTGEYDNVKDSSKHEITSAEDMVSYFS